MVAGRCNLEKDYWPMTSASAPFELRDFQRSVFRRARNKVI